MKIRDITRRTSLPHSGLAWPPRWASSYSGEDKLAGSYDGALKAVERVGNRLRLTIEYDGQEYFGILEWEPPPPLETVERVLRENLDTQIRLISELEV